MREEPAADLEAGVVQPACDIAEHLVAPARERLRQSQPARTDLGDRAADPEARLGPQVISKAG